MKKRITGLPESLKIVHLKAHFLSRPNKYSINWNLLNARTARGSLIKVTIKLPLTEYLGNL